MFPLSLLLLSLCPSLHVPSLNSLFSAFGDSFSQSSVDGFCTAGVGGVIEGMQFAVGTPTRFGRGRISYYANIASPLNSPPMFVLPTSTNRDQYLGK